MVQKLGVMKKMKVGQEGPMYTGAINLKRASVLDLISQATYI